PTARSPPNKLLATSSLFFPSLPTCPSSPPLFLSAPNQLPSHLQPISHHPSSLTACALPLHHHRQCSSPVSHPEYPPSLLDKSTEQTPSHTQDHFQEQQQSWALPRLPLRRAPARSRSRARLLPSSTLATSRTLMAARALCMSINPPRDSFIN